MGGTAPEVAAPVAGFMLGGPGGAAAAGALASGARRGVPGAAQGALLGYAGGQLASAYQPGGATMIPAPGESGMMLNLPEGVTTRPSIDWQAAGTGLMGVAPMLMEPGPQMPPTAPYQPTPPHSALRAFRGY